MLYHMLYHIFTNSSSHTEWILGSSIILSFVFFLVYFPLLIIVTIIYPNHSNHACLCNATRKCLLLATAESTEFPLVESLGLNISGFETPSLHLSSNSTASGSNDDTVVAGANNQLGHLLMENPSEEPCIHIS